MISKRRPANASAGTWRPARLGVVLSVVALALALSGCQLFTTVVGGPGGPAPGTHIAQEPFAVAVGANGDVYVADTDLALVRVLEPSTGIERVVAGTGAAGFSGDGGPATAASLDGPEGVAIDAHGNVVIADTGNNRLRVLAATTATFYGISMTAGRISTVAGNGTAGYSGDGGPALGAALWQPTGIAVDRHGNLVTTDSNNNRVRVVAASSATFYGIAMTAGDIYTVAGNGTAGFATGDGGPATDAEFYGPTGVVVDGHGNLVIGDYARVRVVAVSSATFYGIAMTAGDIYTVAGNGTFGFSGDGGAATAAKLAAPFGLAFDSRGNLVIGDSGASRVRMVAITPGTFYGIAMSAGNIATVAGSGSGSFILGDGGPATSAALAVFGVAVDAHDNLVIGDVSNHRVRVVAAATATSYGIPMTAADIYTIAGNNELRFSGDGDPAPTAELNKPTSVTVDASGDLVIGDFANSRVRVVPAHTGTLFGVAVTAGNIATVAGDGMAFFDGPPFPDGEEALKTPVGARGVAIDAHGNVVVSTSSGNNRVRILAAGNGTFYGRAMTAGRMYTLAGAGDPGAYGDGGPATGAALNTPLGVAVDANGNVLIADSANNRVRLVAAKSGTFYGQALSAGTITTIAGTGTQGFAGFGGPAVSAQLNTPSAVAVDANGNVLIADTGNQRVRVVATSSGTFYGIAMTAGHIATIAGNANPGFSGDGGRAVSARLNGPLGVTVDANGNVLVADTGNQRLRVVAASAGTFYKTAMQPQTIATLGPIAGDVTSVAVAPSGDVLVTDRAGGRVRELLVL